MPTWGDYGHACDYGRPSGRELFVKARRKTRGRARAKQARASRKANRRP